ncbi:DUF3794 and LysM peptidoglycan-binding domain-containing protein [Natranaerofaba carboxydovora]|uniref:DUF3794 and LysM peptidoglycan-binding domain-containing protein n=1 Tax=Natranaerofaba carboxydovora TaxID=2742683 RepID=UPI001F129131|nr:SPOCS domain-containing protein [Natranaerofaba carboxydovora]UMZ75257.1 putative cell wall hydrolase LytN [Natranaerofaba carboxydovora]
MSHKDIELEKELLKVKSVVGEGVVQTNVEADITLPAPVRKIREPVDAEVNITDTEVIEDKVIVKGVLEKQVYFVDDKTGTLHEKSFEENFSVFVDIPGAEPGNEVQVRPRVEFVGVEEKDNNDKKDHLKEEVFKQLAVIEVFVKVTEEIQLEVVTDAVGTDIEVETELLKVEDVIGEDTTQTELISDVKLDYPVRKVESVDTRFEDVESRVLDDKVIVEGTLVKQIYFVDPELDVVREQTATENFSVTIDIPGARPGMNVQEFPRVEFVDHEIVDDFNLRQTAVVEVFAKVTETVQIEVVTDIIGVETVTELLKVSPVIGEDRVQQLVEADTKLSCPARKIQQVQGEFRDVEGRVIDDKVIVEGTVHKQIFFVDATTDEVIETSEDVPFTVTIDILGAMPDHQVQISPRIETIQEEIDQEDPTLIRETIVVEVFAKVTQTAQHEVVIDLEDEKKEKPISKPKKKSGPSLKIYVVQKNDTIYHIAEKFDVAAEDIIKANNIKNPDMIFPGQKLLIPM